MNVMLKIIVLPMTLAVSLVGPGASAQADSKTFSDCKTPTIQKQMNDCAYEDFLAANAGYAEINKSLMDKLHSKQRDLLMRAQKSWIAYRTATCAFESSAVQGGSAQGMVNWQCAARMTRARVVELNAIGNCREGDLACVRLKK